MILADYCSELKHEQWELLKESLNFGTGYKLMIIRTPNETKVLIKGFDKTYTYTEDEG